MLKYAVNETRRFHTIVANRAVIRKATDVIQWRHIGTKLNHADKASRVLSAEDHPKIRLFVDKNNIFHQCK